VTVVQGNAGAHVDATSAVNAGLGIVWISGLLNATEDTVGDCRDHS
jgi:hypothetical protein